MKKRLSADNDDQDIPDLEKLFRSDVRPCDDDLTYNIVKGLVETIIADEKWTTTDPLAQLDSSML